MFNRLKIEWPTVALIILTYTTWFGLIWAGEFLHSAVWIVLMALVTTLFMSITHEVIHGHPTRNAFLNQLFIALPIGWLIPYERFRDTHIAHHETGELTDPFDDPESWYLSVHSTSPPSIVFGKILEFNNTLFGRMLIGPIINATRFFYSELIQMLSNKLLRVYLISVWVRHIALCALLVGAVSHANTVPLWQFGIAVYFGYSLLLVRTFLEHQAAPDHSERTVIIEQSCPLAFIFLFNNLHVIHHDRPGIPWYRLPRSYQEKRDYYQNLNNNYVYRSYTQVFRKYFFRVKEPILHPFL